MLIFRSMTISHCLICHICLLETNVISPESKFLHIHSTNKEFFFFLDIEGGYLLSPIFHVGCLGLIESIQLPRVLNYTNPPYIMRATSTLLPNGNHHSNDNKTCKLYLIIWLTLVSHIIIPKIKNSVFPLHQIRLLNYNY